MLLQFKGDSLTSSEPSRQLSCPSQRRLADTQPPLVHTYSLTEQDGTTAEEKSVTGGCVRLWLVGDSSDLTEYTLSYSQWTKRKCFFDLQKNNNYKLNSSHLQYNVVDNKGCTKEDGSVVQSVVGAFFTCFLAAFFIFTHLAVFLPVTQPLHRDAQVVVTAKLVVWAVCLTAFLQLNTAKNIKDTSSVQQPDRFLLRPPAGRKQKTTSYIVKQLTQRSLTQSVTMKERSEGLTNVHMNATVVLTQADLHCWNRAAPPPPRARCGSGGEARLPSVSVSTEWGLHVWFQRRAV